MKFSLVLIAILFSDFAFAFADSGLCYPLKEECWPRTSSSTAPAYPNSSSSFQINPSAVPLEDKFGFEMIRFNDSIDFGVVRGTGRVGAALSPSNGEETFFGPPGFEMDNDFLQRMILKEKYPSQKISLATAVGLLTNKKTGLNRAELNFGLIGKYHQISKNVNLGYGTTAVLGPLQVGYSFGKDEFLIDDDPKQPIYYEQYGYSVGLNLNSIALDYSQMRITGENFESFTVKLITGSLMLQRWIFTASSRLETSFRPMYDEKTQMLVTQKIKNEVFYGIQYSLFKNMLIGGYYNYYLHSEYTAGFTLFF